ncbi:hypothetical protein EHS13_20895 [Paenibacillus psychroresistens]|uniref:Uncharacterized protein n=1 Tax=Paenibacillus psychroresistens TaxID=1778678 RepID=A0A6B8RMV3_9BACL|nr:hypothetical protein [Paenibacillus psychroresistens]QGQ97167.1 hypothetical protein EHS13_20895 [Paenibacillus psychroresistens]
MVSNYTSHAHRFLSKLGRLKILHLIVFSIVTLLVLLVYHPDKADASLGGLLPVEVPILSQLEPSPTNTPTPQQSTAAQATPTPAASLLEVVVPQIDLGLPGIEVKLPETQVLDVKLPESGNILPQIKIELPAVEVPKVDLPLVSLPPIQINLPAILIPEVELLIPVQPVVTVESKPIEIKVPSVQVNVPQLQVKSIDNQTSTPTQTPSPQHVEPSLQPIETNAATATPTIKEKEAVVKKPDKLVKTEPRSQTTNDSKTDKVTKVPLPHKDQGPYRLPIEAIWVNTTTGTAGNGNGLVSTNGPVGFASQVFIISDTDTINYSISSRVYYTIFAKSDQWAQAPPGQPPKNFSAQPKKSK